MSQVFLAGPWWRSVPNVISLSRFACTPILLMAAFAGHPDLFRWLLLICLISDIADGWIARRFNLRSEFGAKLDSRADMAVQAVGFAGMWNLHRAVVSDYRLPLLFMVAMYLTESLLARLRYGRISSFHTLLSRLAAYAQGIFLIWLLFWGFLPLIFYLAVGLTVLASFEEMLILYVLPAWEADVGGLYWVLKRKRVLAR
jgi:phosphatidylglycerophosphate synthase